MTTNNLPTPLMYEGVWLESNRYEEAEIKFHELHAQKRNVAKPKSTPVGDTQMPKDNSSTIVSRLLKIENDNKEIAEKMASLAAKYESVCSQLVKIEKGLEDANLLEKPNQEKKTETVTQNGPENDDDIDLFGSDEETEEDIKIKEERKKAYETKKAKKPALVAKSSIVLDVKPWDDTTDMKAMEVEVRKIQSDGLKWGASQLVPLAYGIRKLQIVAVVEDEKVSVDWLQETIQGCEDMVQSVDIAAFNKL